MFAPFLTPAYLPFAIAFVVMIGIGLIEAIGLGLGHVNLDGELGVDADGGVLDWLGLGGELPILIWLTSLLGCFTLVGIAIQQIATALTGAPLYWGTGVGRRVSWAGALLKHAGGQRPGARDARFRDHGDLDRRSAPPARHDPGGGRRGADRPPAPRWSTGTDRRISSWSNRMTMPTRFDPATPRCWSGGRASCSSRCPRENTLLQSI